MKKIPTLFVRDQKTHQLIDAITPGAEWVAVGEGFATRKYDGTPVLLRDGHAFKRLTIKAPPGQTVRVPDGWIPGQDEPDPITGELPGWVPVTDGPEDEALREALAEAILLDGTYEAIGPKINGNPEGLSAHRLTRHGETVLADVPVSFTGLQAWFAAQNLLHQIEGIVWHHSDGRMVKIKGKDFGIRRTKVVKDIGTVIGTDEKGSPRTVPS